MNYQQTVDYLYDLLPMFQKVGHSAFKKDLTNTRLLCTQLGNPQEKFKSIHIAGTNGKGSTAHTLAAILQMSGYKTGLYTSPHLKTFTERIRINGDPIGEQQVVDFVSTYKHLIEQIRPSFFEMTVAMAFDEFARQHVDIAVIEVGMGGRFDSTNIINPVVSVITNIGYDHQQYLGDTLPEIAFEKAGIIKQGIPVIVSERQKEVEEVFIKKAKAMDAPIYFADDSYHAELLSQSVEYLIFNVRKDNEVQFEEVEFQLKGNYQLKNVPGILKAIDVLNSRGYTINPEHVVSGMKNVKQLTGLRGRWEVLSSTPLTICDTAHNVDGLQQALLQLRSLTYRKLFIVFGVVKDKDPDKVLELLPKEAYYVFTQASIPRAMDANVLYERASAFGLTGEAVNSVNLAIKKAENLASSEDLIFIGGSIFLIAEIENL